MCLHALVWDLFNKISLRLPLFVCSMNVWLLLVFLLSSMGVEHIDSSPAQSPCGCHTWHKVQAERGTWNATIRDAVAASMRFLDIECDPISSFQVTSDQNFSFGFLPGNDDTFDVAYTLSLVSVNDTAPPGKSRSLLFASPACVYLISAAGAANPDVRGAPYNGATCQWQVNKGVGENYVVNLPGSDYM